MPRCMFQGDVRKERLAEYRVMHQSVWPEMLEALAESGFRNYSIFLCDDGLLIGRPITSRPQASRTTTRSPHAFQPKKSLAVCVNPSQL